MFIESGIGFLHVCGRAASVAEGCGAMEARGD
jgi:hypothetical protein